MIHSEIGKAINLPKRFNLLLTGLKAIFPNRDFIYADLPDEEVINKYKYFQLTADYLYNLNYIIFKFIDKSNFKGKTQKKINDLRDKIELGGKISKKDINYLAKKFPDLNDFLKKNKELKKLNDKIKKLEEQNAKKLEKANKIIKKNKDKKSEFWEDDFKFIEKQINKINKKKRLTDKDKKTLKKLEKEKEKIKIINDKNYFKESLEILNENLKDITLQKNEINKEIIKMPVYDIFIDWRLFD